jgi:hypothetical protein
MESSADVSHVYIKMISKGVETACILELAFIDGAPVAIIAPPTSNASPDPSLAPAHLISLDPQKLHSIEAAQEGAYIYDAVTRDPRD